MYANLFFFNFVCILIFFYFKFPSWYCIPIRVKPLFFSLWSAANCLGCILLIGSCIAGSLEQYGKSTSAVYLVLYGIGSMLTCITMLRY